MLSTTQQLDMTKPYIDKDVRDAIFSFDSNNSPCYDAYGSDFFQKGMEDCRNDVTTTVLQFVSNSIGTIERNNNNLDTEGTNPTVYMLVNLD